MSTNARGRAVITQRGTSTMKFRLLASVAAVGLAGAFGIPVVAVAQTSTGQAPPAAAAAAPAAPTSNAMTTPAMAGPITANPNPFSVDLGDWLGKTYITGELTGMVFGQTNPTPGGFPANRNW